MLKLYKFKQNGYFFYGCLLMLLAFNVVNPLLAQQAVTVTWPLGDGTSTANISPMISGSVTADDQTFGTYLTATGNATPVTYNSTIQGITGFQKSFNGGVAYAANTTDVSNCYVEYKVRPNAGKNLTVSTISVEAFGGGSGQVKMAILYSLTNFTEGYTSASFVGGATYNQGNPNSANPPYTGDASLASPLSLVTTSNPTAPVTFVAGQQIATLTPATPIVVADGKTLTVRMYVWLNGTSGTRYLASKNVVITGTTSVATIPLELVDFSGKIEKGNGILLWRTANEINVKGYEVEKSIDGKNFGTTGFVGATASGRSGSYTFTDTHTVDGTNYYRLKMMDNDGSFTYSRVVAVATKAIKTISISPNPTFGSVTIKHNAATTKTQLFLFDVVGKLVKTVNPSPEATQTDLNVQALPVGNYFVKFSDDPQVIMFSKQ